MRFQEGDQVRRIEGDRTEIGIVTQPLDPYVDVLWPGRREQRERAEKLEVVNPA